MTSIIVPVNDSIVTSTADNDSISLSGGNHVIVYASGSGNDTIVGFNSTDTLRITDSPYASTKNGNDVLIYVSDAWIKLSDAASVTPINIEGEENTKLIILTDGDDTYYNRLDGATIMALGGNDSVQNDSIAEGVLISGAGDNDTLINYASNVTLDGGAGDDVVSLSGGSNASVNTSQGNDTIQLAAISYQLTVEGFGVGDEIRLASTPSQLTAGGYQLIAGNVSISGIDSIATSANAWSIGSNDITYRLNNTAGASLSGNTITYATASSEDLFTVHGLNSTVGVSVDGSEVILTSAALSGKSGTISISGGDYTLALSGVNTTGTVAAGWDITGSWAVYKATHTTAGWSISDNKKVITYSSGSGSGETLLALSGVAERANLEDISAGEVHLVANNFSSSGVSVMSNLGGYYFTFDEDFNSNTFTGTASADSIINHGSNISIIGGAGSDSLENSDNTNSYIIGGDGADTINNTDNHYATLSGGNGNDSIHISDSSQVTIDGGADNDYIYANDSENISINSGAGADTVYNEGAEAVTIPTNATILGGGGNDLILNEGSQVMIDGGADNDTISSSGSNVSINGGSGNDLIQLGVRSEELGFASVNVSQGDDTIQLAANSYQLTVEGFGVGDEIHLSTAAESLATMDGGIIAGNVSISGISSVTTGENSWSTSSNSVTYWSATSNGPILSGNKITYSTQIGGDSLFTITGLNSSVGVAIDSLDVYLTADALSGKRGTISISGGDYRLALSGVDSMNTVEAGWDSVGLSGRAIYRAEGASSGWSLASDRKSVTYATAERDSLLVLSGVRSGAELMPVSDDTVYLTAEDFGSSGVTVTSNPNKYQFDLSGEFEGKRFVADSNDDTIQSSGSRISISAAGGNDSIYTDGESVKADGGAGNDSITNYSYLSTVDGGDGDDSIANYGDEVTLIGGSGSDTISSSGLGVMIRGGSDDDLIELVRGNASVDVASGNDTITLTSAVRNFAVEGFAQGDMIRLARRVNALRTISGGIAAGNVSISGISSIASVNNSWGIFTDSINYTRDITAGAILSGNEITMATEDSSLALFTVYGLNSTTGVSLRGSNVILTSDALSGKSGTISLSGDGYQLALSGVETSKAVAADWNISGGVAVYNAAGKTQGWSLASDRKSVSYSSGERDSLLALGGVATDTTLQSITSDTVNLTANNFGSSGVSIASNPHDYRFNLSGNFNGNSFTGTSGNDSIISSGSNISINGAAGDDIISLNGNATVNTSQGNDTITLTSAVRNFAVEGFGVDDVINLSQTVSSLTVEDNSLIAGNVTIGGINSIASVSNSWEVESNRITYARDKYAGAVLSGRTITYEKTSGSEDLFTVTGLNSTVGVSVDGSNVILTSDALSGKSGTISLSGEGYNLALSGVKTAGTVAASWNISNGTAIYNDAGTTSGWRVADDKKSVSYLTGKVDSLLALSGVATDTTLQSITSDTVNLTANNFGSSGVSIASNPHDYRFNLSGNFSGNSFTGTSDNDSISVSGSNVSINGAAGNDLIGLNGNATVNTSQGDDTITLTSAVRNFAVEGFNSGDVIKLQSGNPALLQSGNLVIAGNVTIAGISSVRGTGTAWDVESNRIIYNSTGGSGAVLNGNEIRYTVGTLTDSLFAVTGLNDTVGVNVSGSNVILTSAALSDKSGTISITDGDYQLGLSGVETAGTVAASWNISNGVATYNSAGTTSGWNLADDKKSVSYSTGKVDSLLAISGVEGSTLPAVTNNTVNLTSGNFSSGGVSVTSNPHNYGFYLGGSFGGKSFTATSSSDTINVNGAQIQIYGGGGNDSIKNTATNSTINGGGGADEILNSGRNDTITAGAGNDRITLDSGTSFIAYSTGDGRDTVWGFNASDTLEIGGGSGTYSTSTEGNDLLVNVDNGSVRLIDCADTSVRIRGNNMTPSNNDTTPSNNNTTPSHDTTPSRDTTPSNTSTPTVNPSNLSGRIHLAQWTFGFTPPDWLFPNSTNNSSFGSPALTVQNSAVATAELSNYQTTTNSYAIAIPSSST